MPLNNRFIEEENASEMCETVYHAVTNRFKCVNPDMNE